MFTTFYAEEEDSDDDMPMLNYAEEEDELALIAEGSHEEPMKKGIQKKKNLSE